MAFYRCMVLLLYFVWAVAADRAGGGGAGAGEDDEARLPRSVVVVVTPMGAAEQQLLGTTMPTCQRIVACSKDVYPWWRRSQRHCECTSALDQTLRQLARWAREARGMPTAVLTALNPTNSTDEPIVLTMSLPDELPVATPHRSDADLIQLESDFLTAMTGRRKLLWTSPIKKVDDDLYNEIPTSRGVNEIVDNNERKWFEKEGSPYPSPYSSSSPSSATLHHDSSFSFGAHDRPKTHIVSSSEPSSEKKNETQTHMEEITTKEKANITSQSNKEHHHGNHTQHDQKCSHGKGEESAKCTHGSSTFKGCGASKSRGCQHGSEGDKPNTTFSVESLVNFYDLRGLQISSKELQYLMFRQWLHSLEPSLSIVTRFRPVGLPLELPLRLTSGLPRELMAYDDNPRPRMHLEQQHVLAHETESALLSATRKALNRLETAAGHNHGSLLIVRSLASLSGAELAALLIRLGVDVKVSDMVAAKVSIPPGKFTSTEPPASEVADELGGDWSGAGGFSTEQLLDGERLVVVLNACPTVFDNGLDLFAHGPRAEDLQKTISLEHFHQVIEDILTSTTTPHVGSSGGVEELAAVELPRAKESLPRVRLHVTRVRHLPCAGRVCIQPVVNICKNPLQKNCLRPRRNATTATPVNTSTHTTAIKRKPRAPSTFWRFISELRRMRQRRWLTGRHRKSSDVNRPEEETEDELGDRRIKTKRGETLTIKDLPLDPPETAIKKKRQTVDEPKKEDDNEVALEQAPKSEAGTRGPEGHSYEAKEERRGMSEPVAYTPISLEKEKERETTKTVGAGEQIIQQKTNISQKQTIANPNGTSSDEVLPLQHPGTEPTAVWTNGTQEGDDDADEKELVAATYRVYDDSSRDLTPEDLLIEADRRGVEDVRLKSASRPLREGASPLAAFAFTPLLLVLAR